MLNNIIQTKNTKIYSYVYELNFVSQLDALIFSYIIFLIGLAGLIFNFNNFLATLLTIEIMYLGITFGFILGSYISNDSKGQIFALLLLTIATSESAVGLGILIIIHRYGHTINFEDYAYLRN
jgi:NADH:ubiquinone oxidoreductase subunit K